MGETISIGKDRGTRRTPVLFCPVTLRWEEKGVVSLGHETRVDVGIDPYGKEVAGWQEDYRQSRNASSRK